MIVLPLIFLIGIMFKYVSMKKSNTPSTNSNINNNPLLLYGSDNIEMNESNLNMLNKYINKCVGDRKFPNAKILPCCDLSKCKLCK